MRKQKLQKQTYHPQVSWYLAQGSFQKDAFVINPRLATSGLCSSGIATIPMNKILGLEGRVIQIVVRTLGELSIIVRRNSYIFLKPQLTRY